MNPRPRLAVACVLALGAVAHPARPACAQRAAPASTLGARVDAYFAPQVRSGEFAGAVLVARGDRVLVRRAYGLANAELGVPMRPEHGFMIASVTKTMTGALVSLLAAEGTLGLGDSVARWLPDFPNAAAIRVRHLLLHAGGLANPDYEPIYGRQLSVDEVLAAVAARPPRFAPGTRGEYSNAGFNLLTAVLERASGRPYAALLAERITRPLAMTTTGDASGGVAVPGLATAYVLGPGPLGVRPVVANASQAPGSGSLYSTVDDLFKWSRALQRGTPVDPRKMEYPYGWGRRERAGGVWLEQTGSIDGWSSNVYLGLDSAIVVVVLANRQAATFGQWGRDIAGMVMGETVKPLPVAAPAVATTAPLADYAGAWRGPFSMRVTAIGGNLWAEVGDWPVTRWLRPVATDRFVVADFEAPLRFERDGAGRVTGAVWGDGDQALRFARDTARAAAAGR